MELLHANILGEKGIDIIVLHGFLGMGDNWKSHARQWSDLGYRVHLLDQRNHGRSFWANEFSYALMAEDLLHYVKYHNLEQFTLLGHSMGGKTAMFFSCQYPKYVQQLIVADIAPKYYPPHHDSILKGLAQLYHTPLTSRNQGDVLLKAHLPEAGLRQFLLKNLYRKTPEYLALRINFEVLQHAGDIIGAALPKTFSFSKPTLFLAGALSNYILQEDHKKIIAQFPKAQIISIPEAGHWLHAENPNAFQHAVNQWMTP